MHRSAWGLAAKEGSHVAGRCPGTEDACTGGFQDAGGHPREEELGCPHVAGAGVDDVGGAAVHTMLGAWTLSSKQWGVPRKQHDQNCTLER